MFYLDGRLIGLAILAYRYDASGGESQDTRGTQLLSQTELLAKALRLTELTELSQ